MTEPEAYDYTTPGVVQKLADGLELDITPAQANDAIKQLAAALKASRQQCNDLQEKHFKAMSDMEIRMAQARQTAPKLSDGIRYAPTPNPQMGPDGFPQRGII